MRKDGEVIPERRRAAFAAAMLAGALAPAGCRPHTHAALIAANLALTIAAEQLPEGGGDAPAETEAPGTEP